MIGATTPGTTPPCPKIRSVLLSLFSFLFSIALSHAQPAGLVVNEFSQGTSGSREWVELVVVGPPCSTVDLRGWILDDNNGIFVDCAGPNSGALPGTGIAPGHVRFKFDPIWQAVPVGTILLIYSFDPANPGAQAEIGGLQVDYTDSNCDRLRVIPLNASNIYMEMDGSIPTGASSGCCPNGVNGNPNYTPATYVALNNQGFSSLSLNNNGDAFQVRDPGANFFHGLSYGATSTTGCTPQPQFDGGPYALQINVAGGNTTYQFRNTVSDDYTNVANFQSFPASTTQSPGQPNNCANAQWIGSLRRPPESAFQTSGGPCLPDPGAAPQSICVGQSITLTLPNTNTCTSDAYGWTFSGSGGISIQGSTNNNFITVTGSSPGTVEVTITATVDNSQLYSQGGCTGPQFPESLDYDFPLTITQGPTANSTTLSACNQGGGQATFNLTSANNTVNGNTGLPVSWYLNAAGTIPVPNPSAHTSGPGTVYAVVTSGPCMSAPVPVTLLVLPVPTAFPASMPGCDQGNGQGAFNLTALNSTVNGNSGFTVNYWLDPAATNPINNPSNYTGPPGAIYATVNNGNCSSAPVPITLTVVPAPTSTNTFITVSPIIACGTTTVTVTFFFPSANLYNVSLLYGGLTFNGQNLASGASANFSISQTTDFILTSATLAQNSLCSVNFSNPPVLTVEILDPPNLAISGDTVICTGQSINLDTVVTDLNNPPGIIPITFHTGLPPTAANEVGPVVSPGVTTTYYAFADGGAGCQQTLPFTIAVSSGGTPVLGSTTVCSDDPPLDLSILLDPNYPNGTWSGPGVTNNEFDPAGLTGVQTLTFTPDECGDPATTTVEVLESGMPVLGLDTLCQTDPPIDLVPFQDPNFPDGEWDGPGVSGTTFDPAGQSGETPLVFTPVGFCASPAVADFFVLVPDIPNLGADTLCQNEGPYDLHALLDPGFQDGYWSGPGVSDTLFDPSLFAADTLVTLTFTPSAYCSAAGTTTIFVQALTAPNLGTDTLCDTDPPIDLSALEDPGFPGGVWSGTGVTGTTFDPAGLGGNIALTYVVNAFCVDTGLTNIAVIPSGTPVLGTAAICEISGLFDLSQLQDTLYPAGIWSGPGVSGATFDPAGLSGPVDLIFTPAGNCANPATTTIEVFPGGQPLLLSAILCENDSLLDLTTLQDPLYPDGVWNGPGVSGNSFNPSGLSDTITLTFTPADTCILEATTEVVVLTAPTYSNFTETCDPNNLTYTISFVVGGGVPGTYTINGVLLTDTLFISGPIDTGDPYSFELDDANGCGPLLITGAVFCDCITDAGSMDTGAGPIERCEGESIDALPFFLDGELLDPNDVLQFALHDNSGNVLGNVLAINDTGFFDYPASATPFQSYYISAIAGNDDGTGNVDLNDPCLSVAPGLEVIFRELGLSYSGDATLCETECYDWTLSFTGQAPFTLSFEVTANGLPLGELLTIYQNDTTITFCPSDWGLSSGTAEIQLQTLLDGVCQENLDTLPPVVLTILPVSQTTLDPTLCPGESILVNGVTYDENNPSGTELIPNGNFNGCDSTITVVLSFFPPAESAISETLCDGESITVNGTVYDQSNLFGTEIVVGGSANGCDSTITIDLSFYPPAQSELLQTLCSGESITVNGMVYDENNPSGTELITGGSYTGCDSTVQVSLTFLPVSSFDLTQTLCDGDFVLVNGVTYDQNNPTGTELIFNGNYLGCDSTVHINLGFYPPAQGAINTTLCDGETIVVNGTVYGGNNPSGTEVFAGGSYTGCDSTVTIDLGFFPPATGVLNTTLCAGESIVVNGTIYDENNPSGTELFPGGAFTGCDSTLQVNLTFAPDGENNITTTLCPGESITVNGTVYDEANPLGTEVLPDGNYAGCDSIINIALSFFPPAIGVLETTLCAEDFLLINGVLYDAGNPAGTEIFPGGSFNGCDSTLNIDLSFLDPVVFELTDTLSSGASIVVNGTTYDESNPSGTEVIFNGSYLGCDSTILINLFFQNFQLQYTTLPPTCFGYQDGQLIVEDVSGGKPPYEISIDGQFFLPIDAFPFAINDLSAGAYTVIVEDANGAQFNLTVIIPSKPEPLLNAGSDLVLDLGQSADVAVAANFSIAQIIWEPGDYLDCDTCVLVTIQQPASNISYTITAFDADGCLISDILNVQVQKPRNVYVPNIFSPNADGLNDLFMVFGGREVQQVLAFQVYDRWGNQLYEGSNFQPNDADYGWDGTYQGRKMDAGVYVFYIQVEFVDGEVEILKGGVTLVR